jgi:hypothetical protein
MGEAITPAPGEGPGTEYGATRADESTETAERIADPEEARYAAARAKHTIDAAVAHNAEAARLTEPPDTIGEMDKEYHQREGERLAQRADGIIEDASADYTRLTKKHEYGLIDEAIDDEQRHGNLQ